MKWLVHFFLCFFFCWMQKTVCRYLKWSGRNRCTKFWPSYKKIYHKIFTVLTVRSVVRYRLLWLIVPSLQKTFWFNCIKTDAKLFIWNKLFTSFYDLIISSETWRTSRISCIVNISIVLTRGRIRKVSILKLFGCEALISV